MTSETQQRPTLLRKSRLALFCLTLIGISIVSFVSWYYQRRLSKIGDSTKAWAIAIPTADQDTWAWRVVLPPVPIGQYHINCYSGFLEPFSAQEPQRCLNKLHSAGPNWAIGGLAGETTEGEVTITAKLVNRDGGWLMIVSPGRELDLVAREDWLSKRETAETTNGQSFHHKTMYDIGDPILLLRIQGKPMLLPRRGVSRGRQVPVSDSIVLWIDRWP